MNPKCTTNFRVKEHRYNWNKENIQFCWFLLLPNQTLPNQFLPNLTFSSWNIMRSRNCACDATKGYCKHLKIVRCKSFGSKMMLAWKWESLKLLLLCFIQNTHSIIDYYCSLNQVWKAFMFGWLAKLLCRISNLTIFCGVERCWVGRL